MCSAPNLPPRLSDGGMKRIAILLLAVAAIQLIARADNPRFEWNVDFESVFDNREGDHDVTATKTWFFTRLSPEVGLKFDLCDRIAGGVVWYQPIGCEWDGHRVSPTLYYRHSGERWRFSMGMFPRKQLIEQMPNYLWSDSLQYTQANIRGAMVQYAGTRGWMDFYVDWRGMQTRRQREAFNIVFHGQMTPGPEWLSFGGFALMNHYALQKDPPADQHIVDNFLVNPYVGVDLRERLSTDSLSIRAGFLMTIERNRAIPDGKWEMPAGFNLDVVWQYRWFGIKNTLYVGKPLFPSYDYPDPSFGRNGEVMEGANANPVIYNPMGPGLYLGEPFYQKKFYDRLNLFADILRTRYVGLRASLDFNFTPGSMIFYQRLILKVNLP